jgi:uncharacterized damage-inducible protein DinB
MKRSALILSTVFALGLPVAAPAQDGSAAVNTSKALWQQLTGYITAVAEETPEALYAFKPTPEVRSLGQLVGHVAGAQYLICAAALGEPSRDEDAVERTQTTKAGLVAALKASTEYCARAYAQTDAAAQGKTTLFGQERTRLYALMLNATHNGEHYGNLVTYLRINKIVPPSSRRGM